MGIILRDMETPESCYKCRLKGYNGRSYYCPLIPGPHNELDGYHNKRHPDCSISQNISDDHGRLIEEADVIKLILLKVLGKTGERRHGMLSLLKDIKKLPTAVKSTPPKRQGE